MSEYAVVLQNDSVVKSSDFGDLNTLTFTNDGKIRSFFYKGKKYYAVFDFGSRTFIDYVDADGFDKLIENEKKKAGADYDGVSTRVWKNPSSGSDITFKNYSELHPAVEGDTIYGYLRDESGLCFNYYTWTYDLPYHGPIGYVKASNATPEGKNCEVLPDGSFSKQFYTYFDGKSFYDLGSGTSQQDQRLIGEIASLMKSVDESMITAFRGFVHTGINTGEFTFTKNETGSYSREELIDYKKGLERWIEIFKENRKELDRLNALDYNTDNGERDERLYIICDLLYRYGMLGNLTVNEKIAVLKVLSQGRLMDWYFASFKNGFQQRETLAIKIIQSVTAEQASSFLDKLTSTFVTSTKTVYSAEGAPMNTIEERVSLYKNLFYKIDDFFGQKNFTAFAKQLEDLVLLKNGITPSPERKYTMEQLKTLTKAQFFWGQIRNKNKIKYTVKESNDTEIKINEEVCLKFRLEDNYVTTGQGITVKSGYKEVCAESQNKLMTLNHFDLVSIHFYDNPSFVDTTSEASFANKVFLTYAGFIDYLIEKEDTQIALDIMQASLYLISLAVGFGEVVTAVRSLNIAKALVGLIVLSGDTSVYLTTNTGFRNYIKSKYPNDWQDILDTMLIVGTMASLGGTAISNSVGLLNAYPKSVAAKFVGIGTKILEDSNAVAKLTAEEIALLREALLRFKNALYAVRNDPEVVNIIGKSIEEIEAITKPVSQVRFYSNTALRTELLLLSDTSRIRFLNDFADAPELFYQGLIDNPEYVKIWNSYNDDQKLFAKANPVKSLVAEIENIRFSKEYQWVDGGLPPLLTNQQILDDYGDFPLNMVQATEIVAKSIIESESKLGQRVLVSVIGDPNTTVMSDFFTNYTDIELRTIYKDFLSNRGPTAVTNNPERPYLQPNIAERLDLTLSKKGANAYIISSAAPSNTLERAGRYIGSHAEFRALNDIACKKFGNNLIDPIIFDNWIKSLYGYNRYLKKPGIQPTCVDCFYLTFGVKFIKNR